MLRYITPCLAQLFLMVGMALPITAFANTASETPATTRFIMSREYGPQTMMGQLAQNFVIRAHTLSEGQLDIHFGDGLLTRLRSTDHLEAIDAGIIQIADSHSGGLAKTLHFFGLSSLPLLVDTPEQAHELLRLARPRYQTILESRGQVLLYALPWPPSGLWTRKAIDEPDDLKELLMRAYDRNTQRVFLNLGALPMVLGWADMQPKLARGQIDGVLTSALGGLTAELYRDLPHFTALNYAMPLNIVHMSKPEFDALNDIQREALLAAAHATEDAGWQAINNILSDTRARLATFGVAIQEKPTPALKSALEDASQVVIDSWRSKSLPEENAILDRYLEQRATP